MNDIPFDLVGEAERATGPGKPAPHTLLSDRPFELFAPSQADEVASYIAAPALKDAINISLATGRPLLLTGDPGTGKTSAATWIAGTFGLGLIRFQVKSTSRAQDLLYTFESIDYFRESQIAAAARADAPDRKRFITKGPFWEALEQADKPALLLVDEIDKAPRDFPNDLLHEFDRLEFVCPEYGPAPIRASKAALRPIVVITSNSERRLPDPFLRRCIYHHIVLGEADLRQILDRRLARTHAYFTAPADFRAAAETCFFKLRRDDAIQKKPSVNEFWQWFVLCSKSKPLSDDVLSVASDKSPMSKLPLLAMLIKSNEDIVRMK